jgi:WD40 repeat protein
VSPDGEFCPYVGLQPFREQDRDYFFGRDGDQRVIISNLYASNLTVLYGASGVGKSSVLLAGVVPKLRESPSAAVVVFRDWVHPRFLDELKDVCIHAIERASPTPIVLERSLPLDELMSRGAEAMKVRVVVLLDQFEEYFLYHPESEAGNTFDEEFARAVNREDVDAGILIALREDGVAKLDRFRARIANVLGNAVRLRNLDEKSAQEAIRLPVEKVYNSRFPRFAVAIEEDLVKALIKAVPGRQARAIGGVGQAATSGDHARIETPLLQLLLTKLWKTLPRPEEGPRVLREQTFRDLGGAEEVVERHLGELMHGLESAQLEVCARIFDRLVTPSGTKVACREKDLAEWAHELAPQLPEVLRRLSTGESRVLRPVAAAPGDHSGVQYEIFHDVLAGAVLHWQAEFLAQKERAALQRQANEQRARAEESERTASRLTRALRLARSAALAALIAAAAAVIYGRKAADRTKLASSRALTLAAINRARTDPELGVLLALHAAEAANPLGEEPVREALDAVGRTLAAARMRSRLRADSSIYGAAFGPEHKWLLVGRGRGAVDVMRWPEWQRKYRLSRPGGLGMAGSSPTGKLIAAVGYGDSTVRIWNAETGDTVETLRAPGALSVLCFSADGSMIAAGGAYTAWVWRLGEPNPLTLEGHRAVGGDRFSVTAMACHPRDPILATAAYDKTIRLWNLRSGSPMALLQGHTAVIGDLEFSPDGRELLSASQDGTARIWSIPTKRLRVTLYGHPNTVFHASYSADGRKIVTGGADATARIWDAESGREIALLSGHSEPVSWASFSDEDRQVVTGSWDHTVRTWSASGHTGRIRGVAFSPDGSVFATGSDDRTIRLWDPGSGDELHALTEHHARVETIQFSDDGKRLASGDAEGRIFVWDPSSGRVVASFCCHPYGVEDIALSPDGSRLVSAAGVDGVTLWNVKQEPREVQLLSGGGYGTNRVAFSANGKWIAAGTREGMVRIWDAANAKEPLHEWRAHLTEIFRLQFSPESNMLLTSAYDNVIRLWDVASSEKRLELPGHVGLIMSAVFTPDNSRLITSDLRGVIFVWDTRTGNRLERPPAHAAMAMLSLSKDGTRLASFSWDRTAKVWDTKTWRALAVFTHREQVDGGAISPDGTVLVTATSYDGVRFIPLDPAELIALARTRITRDLTPEECLRFLQQKHCPSLPR